MSHLIRTTMQPTVEIEVDDAEYENLLTQGLIYDGSPPVEPVDPFDAHMAARLEDDGSLTRAVIEGMIADPVDADIAALIDDAESQTAARLRAASDAHAAVATVAGAGIDSTGAADSAAGIQDFLNAGVTAGYKRFFLPPGTYTLGTSIVVPSHVEVSGLPGRTVLRLSANSGNGIILYSGNCQDVRIRGLAFDWAPQSSVQAGLRFESAVGLRIEDCTFTNSKYSILLSNAAGDVNGVLIRDVDFGSVTDYAVVTQNGAPSHVHIERCHVTDVAKANEQAPGAFHLIGSHHRVIDCRVDYTYDSGVMLTEATDVLVQGNTLHGRQVCIFAGTGSRRIRITGNDLSSDGDFGIHCNNLQEEQRSLGQSLIADNHIHDCGKSGINIEGAADWLITGNVIERVGKSDFEANETTQAVPDVWRSGISVQYSDRPVIAGNVLRDDQTTPTMRYGVHLQGTIAGAVVQGNSVQGATLSSYYRDTLIAPYYFQSDTEVITSARPKTTGASPAVFVPASGGAGATATIQGNDAAGVIGLTTGTGASAGALVQVTFAAPLTAAPKAVLLGAASLSTSGFGFVGDLTATGFTVFGDPSSSSVYYWDYCVVA